jgi:hypothetical protein
MRLRSYVDRRRIAVPQDRKAILLKELETASDPPPGRSFFSYLVCFTVNVLPAIVIVPLRFFGFAV